MFTRNTFMLITVAVLTGAAQAATVVQTGSNANGTPGEDWNTISDWDGTAMDPADDYQTVTVLLLRGGPSSTGGASTFGGGSLEVVDGSALLLKNKNTTSTISGAFTLSGGTVFHAPNSGTGNSVFNVSSFAVSGVSDIQSNDGTTLTIGADLTGSGDLYFGKNAGTAVSSSIVAFSGISSFTGTITLGDVSAGAYWSANNYDLTLDLGTSNYTFLDTVTINGTSILKVNSGQTLTFASGDLVDAGGTVADGTYNPASSIAGGNFAGDGTIVVGSGVDTTPPVISTYSPTNNASGVAIDANLIATFDETIFTNITGSIVITNTSDNVLVTSQVTVNGLTLTIDPTDNLSLNKEYAVLISANAITNTAGLSFAGITSPTTWAFDTIRQTVTQTVSNPRYDDWNDAIWGSSPAAAPTAGKDYVTGDGLSVRTTETGHPDYYGPATTFQGDSFELVENSGLTMKNNDTAATVNGPFTLSGGHIYQTTSRNDGSAATLDVASFSMSGESDIRVTNLDLIINKDLTGSGHLYVEGVSTDNSLIFSGISNFTGAITLGAASPSPFWTLGGSSVTLDLGSSDFTFQDTFTILNDSVLQVNNGQTLTFIHEGLVDPVNGPVTSGTYTTAELGANYTGTGTIEVKGPSGTVIVIR